MPSDILPSGERRFPAHWPLPPSAGLDFEVRTVDTKPTLTGLPTEIIFLILGHLTGYTGGRVRPASIGALGY